MDTRLRSPWVDHMAGNTRFQGSWRISGLEGLSDPTTYFSSVKILATKSPPSIYPDWVRTPPVRGNAGSLSRSFIYGLFWLIDMCLSMTLSCLCVITLRIFKNSIKTSRSSLGLRSCLSTSSSHISRGIFSFGSPFTIPFTLLWMGSNWAFSSHRVANWMPSVWGLIGAD